MRIGIVYYSKSGNTRLIAQRIKNGLEANHMQAELIEIEPVKTPGFIKGGFAGGFQIELPIKSENCDLATYEFLIFGAPVWNRKPAPFMKTFLGKAKGIDGKRGAYFFTCAGKKEKQQTALEVFRENLNKRAIKVIDRALVVQMGKGGVVSGEEDIDDFLKAVMSQCSN